MSSSDCIGCGRKREKVAREYFLTDRRKGLEGVWHLAECEYCRMLAMDPLPSDAQLNIYYAAYPTDENVDFELKLKQGSRRPWLRKVFHLLTGDVDPRDFVDVVKGERILDYGCGHAGYLNDFHHRGFAISGAEIANYVVQACKQHGYDVHQVDDFSHIPFPDSEFDIVYLMQVFEHLREPHVFMQELARILKCGGVLYLAVPNAGSFWRKVFGKNWVSGWFAPFHLFHYNRKNLSNLAGQHGFKLVESWSRTPVSWFALNLKACLYPRERKLDWFSSWLDSRPVRLAVAFVLRVLELPVREKDCLVVKLEKVS